MRVLKIIIGTFSFTPLIGKLGRKNAKKMQFRTEPVGLHSIPESLRGSSFLFMTDPHIGGNIDEIAHHVSDGIRGMLRAADAEKTFILHGGDFICGDSSVYSTSEEDITEVASTLFAGTEGFRHFGVVGNHDEEDLDFPRMKQFLEEKYKLHFMTQPRDARRINRGDAGMDIHGLHTLLDHLEVMDVADRNILLDTHIHLLTQSQADFHVVLLHNPDGLEYLLDRLKKTGKTLSKPTLFLAGHTHGATLDLPVIRRGALRVCKTKFKRYKGWYGPKGKYAQTGNWKLYVSTGMGNGPGFDFRLNAHPEVVLFTL